MFRNCLTDHLSKMLNHPQQDADEEARSARGSITISKAMKRYEGADCCGEGHTVWRSDPGGVVQEGGSYSMVRTTRCSPPLEASAAASKEVSRVADALPEMQPLRWLAPAAAWVP